MTFTGATGPDLSSFVTAPLVAPVLPYVFEHIETAAVIADHNRNVIMLNPSAEKLFGYKSSEVVGRQTSMFYADTEDFRDLGRKRYNEAASETSERVIVRYIRKDGTVFEGETSGGPIRNQDSSELVFLALITDVTVRMEAERALNRLHEITSSRQLDFSQRIQSVLYLGTMHFGLPIGIFSRIVDNEYEVRHVVHPEDAVEVGATFELGTTYCSQVVKKGDAVGFHHVANSELKTHPCYKNFGMEAYLGAPVLVDGEPYGTLNFSSPSPTRPFTGQDIELIRLFAGWMGHEIARRTDLEELRLAHQELEYQATTDSLTGLFNRRHMEQRLSQELERANRHRRPMAVALMDFDRFKQLNDTHGHQAGDNALKLFATEVERIARKMDVFARWGGEEFLAVLPDTDLEGAQQFLTRLTDGIRNAGFGHDGVDIDLTISVGVTIAQPDDTPDTITSRADSAMYQAKKAGRDCIRVAEMTPEMV